MKKLFIFLSLIFCGSFLSAQSFYAGVKIGGLISQVDGDTHGGYHKISPTGGIYVRNTFSKNDKWGMSLELNYRNKGSKHNGEDENETYREMFKIDLHYLEMPLMFNYRIEKFKIPSLVDYTLKNQLLIDFGPSLAYLLKGDRYLQRLAQHDDSFRKLEFALNIGIRYYFTKYFFVNYRFSYTFPFTPIRKYAGEQKFFRGMYNNCMMFSIGFEF